MRTTDFGDVIRKKLADNPDLAAMVEDAAVDAHTAREIYRARNEAGLTQRQLADLAGTYQSVIARIEDADYGGHSMRVLKKIAHVLGKRLRVELYDKPSFEPIPTGNDSTEVAWSLAWDANNTPSTSSTSGFQKFTPIAM